MAVYCGSAGEMRVRERTCSGHFAANCSAIAPPMELPNRCTGPASQRRSRSARALACAWGR